MRKETGEGVVGDGEVEETVVQGVSMTMGDEGRS